MNYFAGWAGWSLSLLKVSSVVLYGSTAILLGLVGSSWYLLCALPFLHDDKLFQSQVMQLTPKKEAAEKRIKKNYNIHERILDLKTVVDDHLDKIHTSLAEQKAALKALLKRHHLVVSNENVGKEQRYAHISVITCTYTLKGDYESFIYLCQDLEKMASVLNAKLFIQRTSCGVVCSLVIAIIARNKA